MTGDGITVRVSRLPELRAKLKRIAPEVAARLKAADLKNAEEMASLARSFVPIDTGALKASIKVETASDAVKVVAGDENTEVRSGSGVMVNIARLVEFGTKPHKNKGKFEGSRHPGTKAQPFFYPAFRLIKRRALRRAARELNKALR